MRYSALFSSVFMCAFPLIGNAALSPVLISLPHHKPQKISADMFNSTYHWRSVGPANMGGRVSAISFAPGNSKEFFVTFGTGGIFKTTDMGTSFQPVFEHESTASIGSIQVCDAPANWSGWAKSVTVAKREILGKGKIVWVGSGEGNGRNSSSYGDGVYLSTDGGSSWKNVGLEDSRDIPSLAADPKDPDVCYVAALGHLWGPNKTRGVYKTTDGGKTWKKVLFIDDKTGACCVALDPTNPNIVYAGMYKRLRTPWGFSGNSKRGGIFKSTDGGAHWTKLTGGLPAITGRIGLAISQQHHNTIEAVVESDQGGNYASLETNTSKYGGVFRSKDGGKTWIHVNHQDPRPFYFSKIYLDPKNDKRVFMIGWSIWRSDDGGRTFVQGFADQLHPDWHAFAFDPNDSDHLVAGCDGGLFQTQNLGKTWEFLNIMAVGEFYTVAVDRSTPYRISGGLQDNGCWLGTSNSLNGGPTNADWRSIGGGDGFFTGFDPKNKNIIYSESQGGSISRIDFKKGFKYIQPQPYEGQQGFRFNWNSPFFVSPFNPNHIYLGGNRVFELTHMGDSYKIISPDLTSHNPLKDNGSGSGAETYCTIVSLAESPVKQGEIWSGSDDGLIYVTTNDGGTWKNVTPPQVKGLYVAWIAPSNSDPNRVYAAIDGHRSDVYSPMILQSNDLGRTWKNITGNLPQTDVTRCITEDLHNPDVLFVGTETGAYFSMDDGKNWQVLGNGLPTVSVQDLVIQPDTGDLVAATHGRSVWICDNVSALGTIAAKGASTPLIVFQPQPINFEGIGKRYGNEGNHYFVGQDPRPGAKIQYWLGKGVGSVEITIKNAVGEVVNHLFGSGSLGLHQVGWNFQAEPNKNLPNDGGGGFRSSLPAGVYTLIVKAGKESQNVTLTYNRPKPD